MLMQLTCLMGAGIINLVNIDFGVDILHNVTDGSEGIIISVSEDGHRLNVNALMGGADNNFDVGDAYEVLDGRNLSDVARSFELSLDDNVIVLAQLHVTDMSDNISIGKVFGSMLLVLSYLILSYLSLILSYVLSYFNEKRRCLE